MSGFKPGVWEYRSQFFRHALVVWTPLDLQKKTPSNRYGTPKQLPCMRPAPYAFAIWGVIYLLAAGRQALTGCGVISAANF